MSVGSTWTRRQSSASSYGGRSAQTFGRVTPLTQSGGLQFYGGTIVGNGLTVYPPGYFGAIYHRPGYGYVYGFPYSRASVFSARFGRLPNAYVPWASGGCRSRFAYAYPYADSWPAAGSQFSVPAGRQDVAHPLAISVATSPVQFDRGFSLQSPYAPEAPLEYVDIRKYVMLASRDAAVADEFVPAAVAADAVLPDVEPARLRSLEGLLLQAKGDKALQAAQLELARTFYQAAIAADPNRNCVWHRMALVQLCQRDYDTAASSLKRVVTTDRTLVTEFIDMQTLLGPHKDSPQWAADQSIWQWLMERPASVDRLHLVAVWQGFKGNQQRAFELVELSILAGSDEARADRVRVILKGRVSESETSADDDSEPSASVLPETASFQIPES